MLRNTYLIPFTLLSVSLFMMGGTGAYAMIEIVPPEVTTVPRYGRFEIILKTNIVPENPFDPELANMQVQFMTPSGETHAIPAFYDEVEGKGVWRVRYAPLEIGGYEYQAFLREEASAVHRFESVPSSSDGFIRISLDDPRYFEFDSGKPYFAVGQNVCWTHDYERYFKKMAEQGANYARIWMIHWNVALEWSGGDYPGLGRYHLGNAQRLDRILEIAEHYDIYIMLCFESFNNLRIRQPYPAYQGNPYARENGGMLERPEQFFTHPEAKRLFKNRLRYLVARYAYNPHILCWQFWNEVDIIEKYIPDEVLAWHREMGQYLRSIDPMDHLISTSFANTAGDSAIWNLPEIDYTQNHQYGSRDMGDSIRYWTLRNLREFDKPHLFGEYGTDAGGPRKEWDPTGINWHNGMWAAMLSGSAGTAMLWWWDNYIDPLNLYGELGPVAAFAREIDWPRKRWKDARIGGIRFVDARSFEGRDLEIPCTAGWGQHPIHTYRILRDGTVADNAPITQFLYPPQNEMHVPQTFEVDYSQPGRFEVEVNTVSNQGHLQIWLDDMLALDQPLPAGPGEGPWKQSRYRQEWGVYQNVYDRAYGIDVPAGKHTIRVENHGRDWISVNAYRLTGYQTEERPHLRIFGLQNDREAVLWLQNQHHTWYRMRVGMDLRPVHPVRFSVQGFRDGDYRVEWWDTYSGESTAHQETCCEGGILQIETPEILRDVACKIELLDGLE